MEFGDIFVELLLGVVKPAWIAWEFVVWFGETFIGDNGVE